VQLEDETLMRLGKNPRGRAHPPKRRVRVLHGLQRVEEPAFALLALDIMDALVRSYQ